MRQASSPRWWTLGLMLSLAALLTACAGTGGGSSSGSGTGSGTGSATATATTAAPTATPVVAPPHAFAWYQIDSHHVPQIWASINGGVPRQITHVAPDGSECDDQIGWSPPVFSPDLKHIVASLGNYNCGDASLNGPVSVITVAGGVVSTYVGTDVNDEDARAMGWVDDNVFWFVGNNTAGSNTGEGIYTKPINGGQPARLYATSNDIFDAVYRNGTLFFQMGVAGSNTVSWSIHSFNLQSSSLGSVNISQGQTGLCGCGSGGPHGPGWDVTQDGAHVAYSYVTPDTTTIQGIASTKIYTSNINGSNKKQIAQAMFTHYAIDLLYSWNGQWIAMTEAGPTPATLTASVNSSGTTSDPNFHGYSPDTYNYPVWKWDNSQFWAEGSNGLYGFHRNGSSYLGVAKGSNPWYTIGS